MAASTLMPELLHTHCKGIGANVANTLGKAGSADAQHTINGNGKTGL